MVAVNPEQTLRVAVIGGGISGLSAAYYLQKYADERGVSLALTVLESADRWGGKVLTEQRDGFTIEGGPDSFLTQKPWALQLARELGLGDSLLGTNDHKRNTYVLVKGRPVVLPDGVMLLVPTKFMPFALSPLISPLAKLRMGLDLFIPRKRDDSDETLSDFVLRRLGREALDKIAEPLMSGIYNAEADKQSVMATFPRFRQIEKEHGSLIRGMLQAKLKAPPKQAGLSAFMSFVGGTQSLIEALLPRLKAEMRLNTRVESVTRDSAGVYTLTLNDGQALTADALIITTPAYVAADLLRELAPQAAQTLESIRYVSTGTISLAYKESDIRKPLNGFGVVVPMSERRPINAITIASTKFDRRAPQGEVLLRVFFGGSRSPEMMHKDDADVERIVREQLRLILGIEAAPRFARIFRWNRANPQYDVGHLERVSQIEAALPPGVYLTGSAFRGVGLPDCVMQAQQTAQTALDQARVNV